MKCKKATIRGEGVRECPFGLKIPLACNCAGGSIKRMAPVITLESEKQKKTIKKANGLVYIYHKENKKCPFADKLLNNFDKVDCDWGDTGQGEGSVPFVGSPIFPDIFQGLGFSGLFGYPLGFYSDNNYSRNLFFGLYSVQGRFVGDDLIKLADQYDFCGDTRKAELVDKLIIFVSNIKGEKDLKDNLVKMEGILKEYSDIINEDRMDNGLIWRLIENWYGPRQMVKA